MNKATLPIVTTRHRFTLIELLMVISIIAILASLLTPNLRKAMNNARAVACLNNLKNLGVMTISYANDYKGIIPFNGDSVDPSNNFYITGEPKTWWYERFDGVSRAVEKKQYFLRCPHFDATVSEQREDWFSEHGYPNTLTYSASIFASGHKGKGNAKFNQSLPRLNQMINTSWIIGDGSLHQNTGDGWHANLGAAHWLPEGADYANTSGGENWQGPYFWRDPSGDPTYGGPDYFGMGHPGNATNLLYVVGHAGALEREEASELYYEYGALTCHGGIDWVEWAFHMHGAR